MLAGRQPFLLSKTVEGYPAKRAVETPMKKYPTANPRNHQAR